MVFGNIVNYMCTLFGIDRHLYVHPGDYVIDATCGNGYDSLRLASLLKGTGHLDVVDIQV